MPDSPHYRTIYHHDGTVTIWDVYAQTWRRIAATEISDETLATLSQTERARIARKAARARIMRMQTRQS